MFSGNNSSISGEDFCDGVGFVQDGDLTSATLLEGFHTASGLLVIKTLAVDATRHFGKIREGFDGERVPDGPWSTRSSDLDNTNFHVGMVAYD